MLKPGVNYPAGVILCSPVVRKCIYNKCYNAEKVAYKNLYCQKNNIYITDYIIRISIKRYKCTLFAAR